MDKNVTRDSSVTICDDDNSIAVSSSVFATHEWVLESDHYREYEITWPMRARPPVYSLRYTDF
jgi:hypothetical protein